MLHTFCLKNAAILRHARLSYQFTNALITLSRQAICHEIPGRRLSMHLCSSTSIEVATASASIRTPIYIPIAPLSVCLTKGQSLCTSMGTSIYSSVHLGKHLCIHRCTHLCIYLWTHPCICLCIHSCIYPCTHVGIDLCIHPCIDLCSHLCIRHCIDLHIHLYIHKYMHPSKHLSTSQCTMQLSTSHALPLHICELLTLLHCGDSTRFIYDIHQLFLHTLWSLKSSLDVMYLATTTAM